jgi:hypothetical protein
MRLGRKRGEIRYLAKCALTNGPMKVEMVKGNLTIEVNRLGEAAAHASHVALGVRVMRGCKVKKERKVQGYQF